MSLSPEESRLLGGSDLAALVGLSPWGTPLTVYARIVAGKVEREQTPAQRRGTLLEPVVRAMYAEDTGAEILGSVKLRHPRYEFGRASLDDVVRHRGGGRRVLEIKTDGRDRAHVWGEPGTDEVPDYYAVQVAYYLGVGLETGAIEEDTADVAALLLGVDDSPRIYRVQHQPEVYAWLLEAAERFWVDHVVPKRPPPPTAPAREAEAVRRLFQREREPLADFSALPPEDRAAVLAWAEARARASEANAAKDDAELRLKLALGWRAGVEGLPADTGLRRLTWTADKTGKVAWKEAFETLSKETGASTESVARILEAARGEPGRTLRATETREE